MTTQREHAAATAGPVDPDLTAVRRAVVRFGWDEVEIEPIAGGHINDSYFVRSGADEYVVQRVNRSVFANPVGIVVNFVAVHHHIGAGIVPEPVAAVDGRWLVEDGGELWRAYRAVPGALPCAEPTVALVREAGRLLGRFHRSLADFDPSRLAVTLPGFHDLRSRLDALRVEVDADRCGRAQGARAEIDVALAATPFVDVAEELVRRVPLRAAHYDAKLSNILFRGGEAVCLVDLDTVMPGQWFWDVGDLLRSATTTAPEDSRDLDAVRVDPALDEAVRAGYLEALPPSLLGLGELAALDEAAALVTYEQGVRFLTDWLAGDAYYRTIRPGQNLDRARTQFRLLEAMSVGSGRGTSRESDSARSRYP